MSKRILIVDDVHAEQELVRQLLAPLDIEIRDAANGQEALCRIDEFHPDLILMDILMPVMDGFSATRKIKSNAGTRDIPIIMLSSKQEQADHVWAQLQGAEKLIPKCARMEQLVAEVEKWI